VEQSIYGLADDGGRAREIDLTVESDDGYFLCMVVKNGDADEITNVVIDSVEKLNEMETAFGEVFTELRKYLS
jgi:hypothetical protein